MNNKQIISLLVGILSFVFWLTTEDPGYFFDYPGDHFREWWQQLSFAFAVAGLSGFFLFKDK